MKLEGPLTSYQGGKSFSIYRIGKEIDISSLEITNFINFKIGPYLHPELISVDRNESRINEIELTLSSRKLVEAIELLNKLLPL